MSRKHFIALAESLRESRPDMSSQLSPELLVRWEVWKGIVRDISQVCRSFNSRFCADSFETACGGVEL
jgi:hypothetical protein